MCDTRVTIGRAAIEAGVSTCSIRLWEAKGLVTNIERTGTRYRLFSDHNIARLKFIRQAKALGLTLGEIGGVLDIQDAGLSPCPRVVQVIDARLEAVDRAMADLIRLRQALVVARDGARRPDTAEKATATSCPIIGDMENW
jgi:DNA-binding transcriptional MerR regulator